ncbi:MAG: translation initiation factor IF-5A [Candidatus Woesearchaeota archaeon]|nr:MAG: translation initiation factor IF-5A [Candidatus Woesearchaeota archaeon]
MAVENKSISDLKPGRYIMMDGEACKILDMQRSAPGKHGHAKYRVSAQTLISKAKKIKVFTGHAAVQVPIIEKKEAQVLSVSSGSAQIMDMESYETFEAKKDPELNKELKANDTVVFWDIMGERIIKEVK